MRKVLLVVFMVALMAMPASAAVQNIKLSGDVESVYVVRDKFDLGLPGLSNKYRSNFLLTQTRLRVDADLTDKVQATVGLINERAWGEDNQGSNGNNDIDLNLAYVTLKEMLYSPLTVIIGRQNFAFGNSFVVDSAGTNRSASAGGIKGVAGDFTKRTALDAVRATLDYNPLTIDIIAAKVDANNLTGTGAQEDDIDLYGTNVAYQLGDNWQTSVEGYFWTKIDSEVKSNFTGAKADKIYLPGVHVSTNPIKGLNLSAEVAMQRGNKSQSASTIRREAMAGQLIGTYAIQADSIQKYEPMIMTAYTYLSGESRPLEAGGGTGETRYSAWDPFFENQTGGTIYNTLFDLSNAHIVTAKASVKPITDVTASVQLDNLWLDKEVSGGSASLMRPDGSSASYAVTTNKYIGREIGLGLSYDYTDDVTIGAKLNWFNPGEFFASTNKATASQVLVNANVNF